MFAIHLNSVSGQSNATQSKPSNRKARRAEAAAKKSAEVASKHVFNQPKPVHEKFLIHLNSDELKNLRISLSKNPLFQPLQQSLVKVGRANVESNLKAQLASILVDHPKWRKVVSEWKGVSLRDQVWLLQVYQLYNLGVKYRRVGFNKNEFSTKSNIEFLRSNLDIVLPQMDEIIDNDSIDIEHDTITYEFLPSIRSLELLKPVNRADIEKRLAEITKFTLLGAKTTQYSLLEKRLPKCPDAICLLVNLETLDLREVGLETPPNVSQNLKLKHLDLNRNKLTKSPDLSRNVNLESLGLASNRLETPPDFSHNIKLQRLFMEHNSFTTPPDVRHNVNLQHFGLGNKKLTRPPDVSYCINLISLRIEHSSITQPPNVTSNVKLQWLELNNNKLTTTPEVSRNIHLQHLTLENNNLTEEAKQKLKQTISSKVKVKL